MRAPSAVRSWYRTNAWAVAPSRRSAAGGRRPRAIRRSRCSTSSSSRSTPRRRRRRPSSRRRRGPRSGRPARVPAVTSVSDPSYQRYTSSWVSPSSSVSASAVWNTARVPSALRALARALLLGVAADRARRRSAHDGRGVGERGGGERGQRSRAAPRQDGAREPASLIGVLRSAGWHGPTEPALAVRPTLSATGRPGQGTRHAVRSPARPRMATCAGRYDHESRASSSVDRALPSGGRSRGFESLLARSAPGSGSFLARRARAVPRDAARDHQRHPHAARRPGAAGRVRRAAAGRGRDPARRGPDRARGARAAASRSGRPSTPSTATSTARRCARRCPARGSSRPAARGSGWCTTPGRPRPGGCGGCGARFPDADAVVFGHSHLPLHEEEDGFQLFNPGSPTERRRAPVHTMGEAEVGADGRAALRADRALDGRFRAGRSAACGRSGSRRPCASSRRRRCRVPANRIGPIGRRRSAPKRESPPTPNVAE